MHSSALLMKSSALCCRHFAGEFNNNANDPGAAAAAASTDSWDSALSNSPEDFGGCGGFGGWWSNGGIDSFGGGGRFAEVSGLNDEGYLEGVARMTKLDFFEETEEEADGVDDDDDDADDDLASISSNGSEILQMVDQLLLAFNLEVAAANAADTRAADASDVFDLQTASGLANGFYQPDAADEIPDEDDVSDLQTDDEEANDYWMAEHDLRALDSDSISLGGEDADNEASSRSSASASSAVSAASQQAVPAFLATGLFRMPQEAVLEAMDYWGPLDRIRWLLWRPEPCPPMPQNPQNQQQQQPPLDKSKRACSFLLKGRCRKEDCEFAHDLSRVTCKFWAAGQCFKGRGCPFLHGYAD